MTAREKERERDMELKLRKVLPPAVCVFSKPEHFPGVILQLEKKVFPAQLLAAEKVRRLIFRRELKFFN